MSDHAAVRQNIDLIEEAYEFMLAYAAQGRVDEGAGPDGTHIRTFLERFAEGVAGLKGQISELIEAEDADGAAMLVAFQRDSDTIQSVLALLLGRSNISSEMIDNSNGLIAMRSYLTNLFFIDKVLMVA
jgi:hypothetical protein